MPRTIRKRKRVRQISRKVVDNPGKGLNKFVSPTLIKDEESSDLKNIMFVEGGSPQKRPGFSQVGDDLSNNPRGLASFDTGSNQYVLTVDGTALKYLNGSTWTSISGATFSSTADIDFVMARGDLYIHDGTNETAKLDSSLTLTSPTTTVEAAFGIFYKGYHFVSGVDEHRTRVYMSEPADASDFTNTNPTGSGEYSVYDATTHPGATAFAGSGANYFDVDKDDGDVITGFGKFDDVLIIFKRRAIYQLTIDSSGNPTVDRVSTGIGAINHKSIENVENDLFFLSDDGYYVLGNEPNFFDSIRTNELSARIKSLVDTRSVANQSKVASIYHNNIFMSSIPVGGSTNNLTLTYDRRYLAWSKWDNIDANSWVVHRDANGEEHLYFACDSDTKVYEIEFGTYNDDGVAIDSYWVSKAIDLDNFDIEKRWVDLTLQFRRVSGIINIDVYTDGDELSVSTQIGATGSSGLGLLPLGQGILGEPTGTASTDTVVNVPYRIPIRKNARSIKFKISNARTNENFILLGYSLGYYPFSHYKFDSQYKLQA